MRPPDTWMMENLHPSRPQFFGVVGDTAPYGLLKCKGVTQSTSSAPFGGTFSSRRRLCSALTRNTQKTHFRLEVGFVLYAEQQIVVGGFMCALSLLQER